MATASSLEGGSQENAGNAKMQKKCQKKRKNAADQGDELFWALRPRQDLMERIAETAGPPSLSGSVLVQKSSHPAEGRTATATGCGCVDLLLPFGWFLPAVAVEQAGTAGQTVSSQADGAGPEDPARSPRRPRGDDRRGGPARVCGPCGQADCDELQRLRTCGNSGVRAGGLM